LDVFALANAALFGSASLPTNTLLIDLAAEQTLLTLLHRGTPIFARSIPYRALATDVPTVANRLGKHVQHTLYACEHALQQSYQPDILLVAGAAGLPRSPRKANFLLTYGVLPAIIINQARPPSL
jgi:hypothetical protein